VVGYRNIDERFGSSFRCLSRDQDVLDVPRTRGHLTCELGRRRAGFSSRLRRIGSLTSAPALRHRGKRVVRLLRFRATDRRFIRTRRGRADSDRPR
jgi:hypothetical protein